MKHTLTLRKGETHWPIKVSTGRPASQTSRRDFMGAFPQVHCGCAGLNGSLCPALSSAVGCCERTSGKLWFRGMVSTGLLPTEGRGRVLSSGSWGGESSLGLDGKYKPYVSTCEVSPVAPHLLHQGWPLNDFPIIAQILLTLGWLVKTRVVSLSL